MIIVEEFVFSSHMKFIYFGKKREILPEEQELLRRIGYKHPLDILALDQAGLKDVSATKTNEGERLLKKVNSDDFLVTFDENGEKMDSLEFAEFIKTQTEAGKNLVFCIGGAYGLGDGALERADKKISFGKMIWTRNLARYMALEQIYRAGEINSGSAFHKA